MREAEDLGATFDDDELCQFDARAGASSSMAPKELGASTETWRNDTRAKRLGFQT